MTEYNVESKKSGIPVMKIWKVRPLCFGKKQTNKN